MHAAVALHEHDRQGLERLARYCARPAISLERLSLTDDGRVRYRMKRIFSDGRSEILLDPHDFLVRLCALVPPPRVHLVRYFGAFAAHARGRAALVGRAAKNSAATAPPDGPPATAPPPALGQPPPRPDRPPRLDWQALLMRVHKIDVLLCRSCGGRLLVLAFITDLRATRRILDHLGIAPAHFPARPRPPPRSLLLALDLPADDPFVDPSPAD